mgnify:CR=1 FL=1
MRGHEPPLSPLSPTVGEEPPRNHPPFWHAVWQARNRSRLPWPCGLADPLSSLFLTSSPNSLALALACRGQPIISTSTHCSNASFPLGRQADRCIVGGPRAQERQRGRGRGGGEVMDQKTKNLKIQSCYTPTGLGEICTYSSTYMGGL